MCAPTATILARRGEAARPVLLVVIGLCISGSPAYSQTKGGESLSCPGNSDMRVGSQAHLLGDWCGERTRLEQRGVQFDFHDVSDTLWGFKSQQNSQFAYWNRFRATVDIDFGALAGYEGWYFHATGLWQGGGNLGDQLGLITGPSGLVSMPTARLDSWWIEKRWLDDRIAVRVGQFAGQDFYGNAQYGESFINEPMDYALGNLSTTFETFDPFSTPATEVRVVPVEPLFLKSMVMAGDPTPFSHNPTGFVPQFHGHPVLVAEIGLTPGQTATSVGALDNLETRKGFSGLYSFGAAYNPGDFTSPTNPTPVSGNYLLYWKASQALWRIDPNGAQGLDATFAFDWSPPNVNRNYTQLTAGLRYNEPLPLGFHNSIALSYVGNSLSSDFLPPGMVGWKTEHGVEINVLLNYGPFLVQPVLQYYANVGGVGGSAFVAGFRTKVEF
jgi:carbohydrate-selective porin OprB